MAIGQNATTIQTDAELSAAVASGAAIYSEHRDWRCPIRSDGAIGQTVAWVQISWVNALHIRNTFASIVRPLVHMNVTHSMHTPDRAQQHERIVFVYKVCLSIGANVNQVQSEK